MRRCHQLELWNTEGVAPHVLSVNVSGVQFKGAAELEREIEASLTRWSVDPAHLELELTESVLMEATQRHANTLEKLRHLGTKIAIGYSSLKYLTQYQVNRLKLAPEFVFHVTVDYRKAAVVRAAVRLANELGLEVIAEGVETEAQARFISAPPVPAAKATELLRAGRIEPQAGPLRRLTSATCAGYPAAIQRSLPRSASRRRRLRLVGRGPPLGPRSGAGGTGGVRSS